MTMRQQCKSCKYPVWKSRLHTGYRWLCLLYAFYTFRTFYIPTHANSFGRNHSHAMMRLFSHVGAYFGSILFASVNFGVPESFRKFNTQHLLGMLRFHGEWEGEKRVIASGKTAGTPHCFQAEFETKASIWIVFFWLLTCILSTQMAVAKCSCALSDVAPVAEIIGATHHHRGLSTPLTKLCAGPTMADGHIHRPDQK